MMNKYVEQTHLRVDQYMKWLCEGNGDYVFQMPQDDEVEDE